MMTIYGNQSFVLGQKCKLMKKNWLFNARESEKNVCQCGQRVMLGTAEQRNGGRVWLTGKKI